MGYHVPARDERAGLFTAYARSKGNSTYVGAKESRPDHLTLNDVVNDLLLSLAGSRNRETSAVINQGVHTLYWSSSPIGTIASALNFSLSNLNPQYNGGRANGFSVRCFQNS
jgi:uncharacterized protein (TIGR02145 family)